MATRSKPLAGIVLRPADLEADVGQAIGIARAACAIELGMEVEADELGVGERLAP